MFIEKSLRVLLLVALITFNVVLFNIESLQAQTTTQHVNTEPYSKEQIVSLTNYARFTQNLSGLTIDPALSRAAQKKADDMVKNGYFSHITPTGGRFWEYILDEEYSFMRAGENLAVHYTTLQSLMTGWITSPSHRNNLLDKNYTDIGIGMSYGKRNGRDGWYVVQFFGAKS